MINHCFANCLYSVQELRQDYTAIHKTAWLLLEVLSKLVVFGNCIKTIYKLKQIE